MARNPWYGPGRERHQPFVEGVRVEVRVSIFLYFEKKHLTGLPMLPRPPAATDSKEWVR